MIKVFSKALLRVELGNAFFTIVCIIVLILNKYQVVQYINDRCLRNAI